MQRCPTLTVGLVEAVQEVGGVTERRRRGGPRLGRGRLERALCTAPTPISAPTTTTRQVSAVIRHSGFSRFFFVNLWSKLLSFCYILFIFG